jgi:hypothetical protein
MMIRHDINLARRRADCNPGLVCRPGPRRRGAQFQLQRKIIGYPFLRAAEHRAVVPPWLPAQLHLHDPWPLTAEAVPVPKRPVFGTLVMAAPFAEPQARSREGRAGGSGFQMDAGDGSIHQYR